MYKIIIDTRERLPYKFIGREIEIEYRKLDAGDYGLEIDGILQPIVFERKSPSDACSTLTKGHARFKREILRAKDLLFYVIIECSYRKFLNSEFNGARHTKAYGTALCKACHTMELKYGIRFIWVNNRSEAISYISNMFKCYVKNIAKSPKN